MQRSTASRAAPTPNFRIMTVQQTHRRAGIVRAVTDVNDDSFGQEVLKSSAPVLVDFWAPWCGPCRMIAPLIDELSNEYGAKLKCVKLNTDESPNVATDYGEWHCCYLSFHRRYDPTLSMFARPCMYRSYYPTIVSGIP